MREITFRDAINEAYKEEMRNDDRIITFGESVAVCGGSFQVTKGLLDEFGSKRVRETSISEVAIVGAAIGSAITGLRPIAEIEFDDFLFVAGDQIINQMAKIRYMSGGQVEIPMVIRCPMGGGLSAAAQHSQCFDGLFMHIPGIKIVSPSTPYDAKGLFKSAIRDNNPVMFFEHLKLYDMKGIVPEEEYFLQLGQADIKRKGKDITVVTISEMVIKALKVADKLEKEGIDIEVIDLRTLYPLDIDTVINSIKKTNRAVVAYHGYKTLGLGAEISARIYEKAFEHLDAPVLRVANRDVPVPFAPNMESYVIPQEEDIYNGIKETLNS